MWSQKLKFWLFQHGEVLLFVTLSPSRLSVDTHTRLRPVPKRHLFSGRKLQLRLNSALAAVSKAQCCPTTFIFVLPHPPHSMSPNDTILPDFPSSMSWPHQCPVSTSLPLLRCMRSIDYRFTGRLNSFECGQVSIVPIYSLHININLPAYRHSIQPLLVTVIVSLGSSKTVFVQKPRVDPF